MYFLEIDGNISLAMKPCQFPPQQLGISLPPPSPWDFQEPYHHNQPPLTDGWDLPWGVPNVWKYLNISVLLRGNHPSRFFDTAVYYIHYITVGNKEIHFIEVTCLFRGNISPVAHGCEPPRRSPFGWVIHHEGNSQNIGVQEKNIQKTHIFHQLYKQLLPWLKPLTVLDNSRIIYTTSRSPVSKQKNTWLQKWFAISGPRECLWFLSTLVLLGLGRR